MNTINTPSISSSAVLIDLSITTWTGRKLDKRASQDVTAANSAAKGVANVNKRLLGDCAELDAVQKFAANARSAHYAMTMPWSDLGLRLCPTTKYIGADGKQGYMQHMSELQTEFDRLTRAFLEAYDWEVQNAQLKLGSLFNPDDYPTSDSLTNKFRFRFTAIPVPDAGDWRLDINNSAATQLQAEYKKFYDDQLNNAMKDVWSRTHDALSKMCERLDYTDDKTRKVFRDSLVTNVKEVIELLDVMNITRDPAMMQAQRQLSDAMLGVTPDALREDNHFRKETRDKVSDIKKIIENLPGLGF